MPVSPASLANLRPAWKPGQAPLQGRRSADIDQAIRELRRSAPRAVKFLTRVMDSDEEATSDRIRCAIALLNKVVPDADPKDQLPVDAESVTSITLKVVRIEQAAPAAPVIDAQAEPEPVPPLLSLATRCAGEGDD